MRTAKRTRPLKPCPQAHGVAFAASASFPVAYSRDCLSPRNPSLAELLRRGEPFRRHRVLFVVDAGLAAARPGVVEAAAGYAAARKACLVSAGSPVVVEGGESAKDRPSLVDWLRARLLGAGLDGEAHLVVLGGGGLLDAAGFAAAALRRRPRLTRVPTTLLSQASSAFSTRCAVNALGRKDALSLHYPPHAVLVDPLFLASLSDRQKRAGLAEIARTALCGDTALFHWLADHVRPLAAFERRALETAAKRCAKLRCEAAAEADPFAAPRAAVGDFGLWAALRLESAAAGDLIHGEAVAAGTAVDLLLSVLLAGLPPASARAALELLGGLGLPLWHPAFEAQDERGLPELLSAAAEFASPTEPALPLLRGLGRAEPGPALSAEAVAAALEALRRWDGRGDEC